MNTHDPIAGSSPALPAASVILARQGENGIEVFMLRRGARSTFVPHAVVFPGGRLDDADTHEATRARAIGLDDERLAAQFRAVVPDQLPAETMPIDALKAAGLSIAAIRELFEEAGIALARDARGNTLGVDQHERLTAARTRLRAGESFAALLHEHDWYADAHALHYFSHWITPPTEPRRYDTHFFLAIAPDQTARADAEETHDGLWIAPAAALRRRRDGDLNLVYPTIKHLERIEPFENVEALEAFARTKPVFTIMPTGSPYTDFAMPSSLENAW